MELRSSKPVKDRPVAGSSQIATATTQEASVLPQTAEDTAVATTTGGPSGLPHRPIGLPSTSSGEPDDEADHTASGDSQPAAQQPADFTIAYNFTRSFHKCYCMASMCLLVLSGLPAAGKTTFANLFSEYMQPTVADPKEADHAERQKKFNRWPCRVVRIDYDELIPSEVEVSLPDDSEQVSQWKLYRKAILTCLDNLIGRLCNRPEQEQIDISDETFADMYTAILSAFSGMYDAVNSSSKSANTTIVFIIDDNMYYASMRYQLYQLARKYSIGYAQVYFPVQVDEAVERNSHRKCPVPNDVIVSMASKMDVPAVNNSWEALTSHWHATDFTQNHFEKVLKLIEQALDNPAMSAVKESQSDREESRAICSKNIYHQSDCILRHLLSEFVATVKAEVSDSSELSRRAKQANSVRQRILDELRQHTLIIPQSTLDLMHQNTTPPSNSDHPLRVFLRHVFTERLS